jgi:hypothetical protein
MILHPDAAKFFTAVKNDLQRVSLVELNAETPMGRFTGSGTVSLVEGRYQLEWRLADQEKEEELLKHLNKDWGKPKTYTKDDIWKMKAETDAGLCFTFGAFPPDTWRGVNHQVVCFNLETGRLKVSKPEPDPAAKAAFRARLREQGIDWDDSAASTSVPKEILHHATFVGVKSPLCFKSPTTTETTNDFLGKTWQSKNDTWTFEREGLTFALIQKGDDLNAYLRFKETELTPVEQSARFSAFLEALGFTHGFRPWPLVREVRHGLWVDDCEISGGECLSQMSMAPLSDRLFAFHKESESMVMAAYDFVRTNSPFLKRFRRLHGILCEAHEGTLIRETDLLGLCTVFEGLVGCLFDHHRLKDPTRKSKAASAFSSAVDAVCEWLKQKHHETGEDHESPWDRLIGLIKSSGYVRTQEKAKALADFYSFPWEGDIEEIMRIWKKQRNPLAHGSGQEEDPLETRKMFAAWSRITGAFHRFMLAEMGYSGWFRYSPMEPGMEELKIFPMEIPASEPPTT